MFIVALLPAYARIPGTITNAPEFFVLSGIFGFQSGSMQSFSRVFLSRIIPTAQEGNSFECCPLSVLLAEFFSFFELSDKGSSWLGPLLIGLVNDLTDDIRWGVLAIFPVLALSLVPLFIADEDKGSQQAKRYTEEEMAVQQNVK